MIDYDDVLKIYEKLSPTDMLEMKDVAAFCYYEKGEYETKATEKVCTVTFEALKEYIILKSPKKFKSTNILQEVNI